MEKHKSRCLFFLCFLIVAFADANKRTKYFFYRFVQINEILEENQIDLRKLKDCCKNGGKYEMFGLPKILIFLKLCPHNFKKGAQVSRYEVLFGR
jgi:hypothetical protein